MAIQPNDVAVWLNKSGFPLEMRTAKAFRDAEFHASISQFVQHYDTKILREVDLYGSYSRPICPNLKWRRVFFGLITECKGGLSFQASASSLRVGRYSIAYALKLVEDW